MTAQTVVWNRLVDQFARTAAASGTIAANTMIRPARDIGTASSECAGRPAGAEDARRTTCSGSDRPGRGRTGRVGEDGRCRGIGRPVQQTGSWTLPAPAAARPAGLRPASSGSQTMSWTRILLVPLVLAALAPPAPAGLFSRKPKPDPATRIPELTVQLKSNTDEAQR